MVTIMRRTAGFAAVANTYPEWMELAATVLFRRDSLEDRDGLYPLQQAIAEALMVAHEMGAKGRTPPLPAGQHPRTYQPKPIDPEMEQIATELRCMAWSPKAGTDRPEGYLQWRLRAIAKEQKSPVVVVRRKPNAVTVTKVIRRRA